MTDLDATIFADEEPRHAQRRLLLTVTETARPSGISRSMTTTRSPLASLRSCTAAGASAFPT
ncbi:MAG: hypothetical protein QOI95_90 [Acidimicrobiaceae bacterium]|jgi:hypothetical protein